VNAISVAETLHPSAPASLPNVWSCIRCKSHCLAEPHALVFSRTPNAWEYPFLRRYEFPFHTQDFVTGLHAFERLVFRQQRTLGLRVGLHIGIWTLSVLKKLCKTLSSSTQKYISGGACLRRGFQELVSCVAEKKNVLGSTEESEQKVTVWQE